MTSEMILNVPNFTITENSILEGSQVKGQNKDSSKIFLNQPNMSRRTDFGIHLEGYAEDVAIDKSCDSVNNRQSVICSTGSTYNFEECKMCVPKKHVSKRKSCLPRRRIKMHSEEELVEREVKEYLLKIPTWEKIIPNSNTNYYPYSYVPTSLFETCDAQIDNQDCNESSQLAEESHDLDSTILDQSSQKPMESNTFNEDMKPYIYNKEETQVIQMDVQSTVLHQTDLEEPKMKKQKQKERVFCSVCSKSFGRPSDLRRHAVLHTGEKKHKCDECDKVFSQRYHLVRHLKNVHKKDMKNLVCGLCNQTFNSEYLLTRHVKGHGVMTFVCDVCSKEFKTKRQMKEHILCAHVGMKPFKCDQCDKAFTRKYHLERHMEMHAGTKNFQCEYCGKDFGTKGNLIAHVKRIHLQIKEFSCGVCQKGFYSSKDLQTHIKVHTGEKPFQCDICLRRFSEKSNMEWHLRIHSGDRPYQCDLCNKSYTRLPHLQRHKKEGLCFRRRSKHQDNEGNEDDVYCENDSNTGSLVMKDTDSETEELEVSDSESITHTNSIPVSSYCSSELVTA